MKSKRVTPHESYILRLLKGERVHETITQFCAEKNITSGTFSAIGAICDVELGYYDLEKKSYFWKHYPDAVEVVSMLGNIALVDAQPFLHIHTTISDTENMTSGGHLNGATVAVTLEVRVDSFKEVIHRELDDCVGLKLIAL